MSDLNVVILTGRLTRDPELRYTASGTAVLDIGIASNRFYKSSEETKKETTFVDCTIWGARAESIAPHLNKGILVSVEGRLVFSTWVDNTTGSKRSKLSINCNNVNLLTPKSEKRQTEPEPELAAVTTEDTDDDINF